MSLFIIASFVSKLTDTTFRQHRINIEQHADGAWNIEILNDDNEIVNIDGCHCAARSADVETAVEWLTSRLPR